MLFADKAALAANSEETMQQLINHLVTACNEFGLNISLIKTDIALQDVSNKPSISKGEHTFKIMDKFTFLGSTIINNLSLDV